MCLSCVLQWREVDLVLPEYGYLRTAGPCNIFQQWIPARNHCGRAFTPQCIFLPFSLGIAIVATILIAASNSGTVPWLELKSFNGTSSDPMTWSTTDNYLLDGTTRTTLCPWNFREQSRCMHNPPEYAPIPLSAIEPSVKVKKAAVGVHVTTALSLVISVVATCILAFGVLPTHFYPAAKHISGTADPAAGGRVVHFIAVVAGAALAIILLQAVAIGHYDAVVYDLIASNTTVTTDATGRPAAAMPQPMQLNHGAGYRIVAASIILVGLAAFPLLLAALCAPRWLQGTRGKYYEDAIRAAVSAGALPPQCISSSAVVSAHEEVLPLQVSDPSPVVANGFDKSVLSSPPTGIVSYFVPPPSPHGISIATGPQQPVANNKDCCSSCCITCTAPCPCYVERRLYYSPVEVQQQVAMLTRLMPFPLQVVP